MASGDLIAQTFIEKKCEAGGRIELVRTVRFLGFGLLVGVSILALKNLLLLTFSLIVS